MNLYQQYLVLDMLTKRIESIGLIVMHSMFHIDHEEYGTAGVAVSVSIDYRNAGGSYQTDQEREDKVNEFLTRHPDATVTRKSDYGGKPDMLVRGVTNLGIAWEINFHTGVCVQKQVGTKKVERYDPDALANIPRVTVEEPVFEYLCADPIATAGLVAG